MPLCPSALLQCRGNAVALKDAAERSENHFLSISRSSNVPENSPVPKDVAEPRPAADVLAALPALPDLPPVPHASPSGSPRSQAAVLGECTSMTNTGADLMSGLAWSAAQALSLIAKGASTAALNERCRCGQTGFAATSAVVSLASRRYPTPCSAPTRRCRLPAGAAAARRTRRC